MWVFVHIGRSYTSIRWIILAIPYILQALHFDCLPVYGGEFGALLHENAPHGSLGSLRRHGDSSIKVSWE